MLSIHISIMQNKNKIAIVNILRRKRYIYLAICAKTIITHRTKNPNEPYQFIKNSKDE